MRPPTPVLIVGIIIVIVVVIVIALRVCHTSCRTPAEWVLQSSKGFRATPLAGNCANGETEESRTGLECVAGGPKTGSSFRASMAMAMATNKQTEKNGKRLPHILSPKMGTAAAASISFNRSSIPDVMVCPCFDPPSCRSSISLSPSPRASRALYRSRVALPY
uniref:Uncharacterized protein n=1 Tax=Anopheles farauti TaxID=69004 RepID=A0A182QNN2_9DIPT